MNNRQLLALACVTLFVSTSLSPALCLPAEGRPESRKFAEKPNNLKKVAKIDSNDLDDVSTSQLQDSGFSWSNMLGMIMQMIFNPAHHVGPNKSDLLDTDQGVAPSPWANILSMGLKIITALLGNSLVPPTDGIDKVDNSSPMQFINIVVNLLDALKTSFSHRSLTARSLGKKDSISDAAVASLSLMKGYIRTFKTSDEKCMQKYLCDASNECARDITESSSLYCQLGSYATSFLLERTSSGAFDTYYEAARRGRSGVDCRSIYLECNEV